MNKTKAINSILENFDFNKVHDVMTHLEWKWAFARTESGIPSIGELVLKVQGYLNEAYDKAEAKKGNYNTATGGFQYLAEYNKETEEVDYLDVKFVLTEWDYDEQ